MRVEHLSDSVAGEMKRITAQLDRRARLRKKWVDESERILRRLQNKRLLDEPALFLANVCVELDRKYGDGSQLTLEWMLDFYVALEFERRVRPKFIQIWNALRGRGCTSKNEHEYHDASAFFVPHDTKRIVVMGSWWKYGRTKALVIDDADESRLDKVLVRRIWQRSKRGEWPHEHPTLSLYRRLGFSTDYNESPRLYGDERDNGHVLAYERWAFAGKRLNDNHGCRHVIWNLGEPLHWFSEVQWLWSDLCDTADALPRPMLPIDQPKQAKEALL